MMATEMLKTTSGVVSASFGRSVYKKESARWNDRF